MGFFMSLSLRLTQGCSLSPNIGMFDPISIRMSSKVHRRFRANFSLLKFGDFSGSEKRFQVEE